MYCNYNSIENKWMYVNLNNTLFLSFWELFCKNLPILLEEPVLRRREFYSTFFSQAYRFSIETIVCSQYTFQIWRPRYRRIGWANLNSARFKSNFLSARTDSPDFEWFPGQIQSFTSFALRRFQLNGSFLNGVPRLHILPPSVTPIVYSALKIVVLVSDKLTWINEIGKILRLSLL